MLSVDRHLDTDSVFALTPDGFLILSLSRDEFLSLGIEKSPAVSVIEQQKDNKFRKFGLNRLSRVSSLDSIFIIGVLTSELV